LWHESGQTALENAHVCVFGSSALASESLKNLVLPGIGRFTVIDDAIVDDQDVLTNFFVQHDDAGKPRAECIVAGLGELNPDARGVAVVRAPADVLGSCESSDADLVSSASLVIACGLPDALVHDLGLRCWQLGTPLIVAGAAGFMASIRTVVPEHAGKLDNETWDLISFFL
ncbi:NEDD8-activating enzyme E1 regulatory subunit, partial [Coemansia sp. RSA 2603]